MLVIPNDQDPPTDVVRRWVSQTLADVPVLRRLHTTLVCEELVSNARTHGGAPYLLRLAFAPAGDVLRVLVDDCDRERHGGWTSRTGLALVDGLSRGWGVEWRVGGKTVWAEITAG